MYSGSKLNEHAKSLESSGCTIFYCPANNEDCLAKAVTSSRPDVCIFDRLVLNFNNILCPLYVPVMRQIALQDLIFKRSYYARCIAYGKLICFSADLLQKRRIRLESENWLLWR